MNNRRMLSVMMLSTASLIWGTSFVAQVLGMELIGPLTFCAARYAVALFFVVPFALVMDRRKKAETCAKPDVVSDWRGCLRSGIDVYKRQPLDGSRTPDNPARTEE